MLRRNLNSKASLSVFERLADVSYGEEEKLKTGHIPFFPEILSLSESIVAEEMTQQEESRGIGPEELQVHTTPSVTWLTKKKKDLGWQDLESIRHQIDYLENEHPCMITH